MADRAELADIAARYRAAYLARDAAAAPFATSVRFTENNVEMPFPDGSWDTVTAEVGEPLVLCDPQTGQGAIFTAIVQNDTPGYLAARFKVEGGLIVEVEHIVSTKRNLSSPPTPIAEHADFSRDAMRYRPVPDGERSSRAEMAALGDGYFQTLENNTGEIRNTAFSADALRYENGKTFPDIEQGFRSGRYRFNNKVRRELILVDEELGYPLFRGFIDHKGVMDEYLLTDGTPTRSIFREPHSWGFLEMFKIHRRMIVGVEAIFIGTHYNMRTPWNPGLV
jgi:hypothetical protein